MGASLVSAAVGAFSKNSVRSEPVSMGIPVNSPGDDYYYIPATDNKVAYFSSNRESAFGKCNVYKVSIINENRNFITINGLFNCSAGLNLSDAKVTIINPEDNAIVAEFRTPSQHGEYYLKLPVPSKFLYHVELVGFNTQESLVDLSSFSSSGVIQEIMLVRDESGNEKMTITHRIPAEMNTLATNSTQIIPLQSQNVAERDAQIQSKSHVSTGNGSKQEELPVAVLVNERTGVISETSTVKVLENQTKPVSEKVEKDGLVSDASVNKNKNVVIPTDKLESKTSLAPGTQAAATNTKKNVSVEGNSNSVNSPTNTTSDTPLVAIVNINSTPQNQNSNTDSGSNNETALNVSEQNRVDNKQTPSGKPSSLSNNEPVLLDNLKGKSPSVKADGSELKSVDVNESIPQQNATPSNDNLAAENKNQKGETNLARQVIPQNQNENSELNSTNLKKSGRTESSNDQNRNTTQHPVFIPQLSDSNVTASETNSKGNTQNRVASQDISSQKSGGHDAMISSEVAMADVTNLKSQDNQFEKNSDTNNTTVSHSGIESKQLNQQTPMKISGDALVNDANKQGNNAVNIEPTINQNTSTESSVSANLNGKQSSPNNNATGTTNQNSIIETSAPASSTKSQSSPNSKTTGTNNPNSIIETSAPATSSKSQSSPNSKTSETNNQNAVVDTTVPVAANVNQSSSNNNSTGVQTDSATQNYATVVAGLKSENTLKQNTVTPLGSQVMSDISVKSKAEPVLVTSTTNEVGPSAKAQSKKTETDQFSENSKTNQVGDNKVVVGNRSAMATTETIQKVGKQKDIENSPLTDDVPLVGSSKFEETNVKNQSVASSKKINKSGVPVYPDETIGTIKSENEKNGNDILVMNERVSSENKEKRPGLFASILRLKKNDKAPLIVETTETKMVEIPVDEFLNRYKNLVFRVQVGAFKDRKVEELKKKYAAIGLMDLIYINSDSGLLLVMTGSENNYETATALKSHIIEKGINDAFIVAYGDGARIAIETVVNEVK